MVAMLIDEIGEILMKIININWEENYVIRLDKWRWEKFTDQNIEITANSLFLAQSFSSLFC